MYCWLLQCGVLLADSLVTSFVRKRAQKVGCTQSNCYSAGQERPRLAHAEENLTRGHRHVRFHYSNAMSHLDQRTDSSAILNEFTQYLQLSVHVAVKCLG
jgi:hypothetical protein